MTDLDLDMEREAGEYVEPDDADREDVDRDSGDDAHRDERDFPSSKMKRSGVAARAGLKVGANYARYLARRTTGADRQSARQSLHDSNARDLFGQLTKLRGTALKMAQGLSMDPGVLPEEFTEVLSQAQYSVPPMSSALVRRLVTKALGDAPENVYASFTPEAAAAASLGQVHRAVMKDGRTVAVKIQYPNVRESIDSDLRMMRGVAGRFVPPGTLDPYLEEIRERLMEETDYRQEGRNIEYFAAQYASEEIVTPRWISELTTQNVLTMTWVEGRHLKPFLDADPAQDVRNAYGQLLWDFVHRQIASEQLTVHADAHPGNFLFRDDGRLGVLDFGCVKRFPKTFRNDLLRLFQARMVDDDETLRTIYKRLEILRPTQSDEMQAFLVDVLEEFGQLIALPYRDETFDFSDGRLLEGLQQLVPRLTGREAIRHREPVGSRHFVFVNRLLMGLLSLMTKLEARVSTADSRRVLLAPVRTD